MFLAWRQTQQAENARRKALNEVSKTRIDLEVKDLKERKDTINKIMGEILEDMTMMDPEPPPLGSEVGRLPRGALPYPSS